MPSDADLQCTTQWSDQSGRLLMGISWKGTHVALGDTVTRAAGHAIWRVATSPDSVQSYLNHNDAHNNKTARDFLAPVPMYVRVDLPALIVECPGRWTPRA